MGLILDIIRYASGSIFWGFLIGAGMLAIFFFLIKGWYKNAVFTPVSFICGGILGVLLIIQCTLTCGALSIISMTDVFEEYMTELVTPYVYMYGDRMATIEEGDEMISSIVRQFPLLSHYVDSGLFAGYTVAQLPSVIAEECRSHFQWYIFRRILWSLGFVIVAAVVVIKTMDTSSSRRRNMPQSRYRPVSRRY